MKSAVQLCEEQTSNLTLSENHETIPSPHLSVTECTASKWEPQIPQWANEHIF